MARCKRLDSTVRAKHMGKMVAGIMLNPNGKVHQCSLFLLLTIISRLTGVWWLVPILDQPTMRDYFMWRQKKGLLTGWSLRIREISFSMEMYFLVFGAKQVDGLTLAHCLRRRIPCAFTTRKTVTKRERLLNFHWISIMNWRNTALVFSRKQELCFTNQCNFADIAKQEGSTVHPVPTNLFCSNGD